MTQRRAIGGYVTVSVPLSPEEYQWLEARAAKRLTSVEVEAGKVLLMSVATRVKADAERHAFEAEIERRIAAGEVSPAAAARKSRPRRTKPDELAVARARAALQRQGMVPVEDDG